MILNIIIQLVNLQFHSTVSLKLEYQENNSPYFWSFNTSRTAKSSLSGTVPEAGLLLSDDQSKGFTIRFTADIKSVAREQTLLEIPQVLKVYLRKHDRMIENTKLSGL